MNGRQVRNGVDVMLAWVVVYVGTSFLVAWTRGHLWLGVTLTAAFVLYVVVVVGRRLDRRDAAARDAEMASRDDDGAA